MSVFYTVHTTYCVCPTMYIRSEVGERGCGAIKQVPTSTFVGKSGQYRSSVTWTCVYRTVVAALYLVRLRVKWSRSRYGYFVAV